MAILLIFSINHPNFSASLLGQKHKVKVHISMYFNSKSDGEK